MILKMGMGIVLFVHSLGKGKGIPVLILQFKDKKSVISFHFPFFLNIFIIKFALFIVKLPCRVFTQ